MIRENLEALGVNFEVKSLLGFDVIFAALQSCKALHGDVKVPQRFIVPENDANYPETFALIGLLKSTERNWQHWESIIQSKQKCLKVEFVELVDLLTRSVC